MLLNGFFRVKSYRPVIGKTQVFSKKYGGSFSFVLPEQYNYVEIIYAGAAGQRVYMGDGTFRGINPGRGAVRRLQLQNIQNRTITGVVGAQPAQTYSSSHIGGSGYNYGQDATKTIVGGPDPGIYAGAGGGSTSVVVDGITYTAGGGSGAGLSFTAYRPGLPDHDPRYYLWQGGNGGGPNGGIAPTVTYSTVEGQPEIEYPGTDASDANYGYADYDGYVTIYAGYNPEYEQ